MKDKATPYDAIDASFVGAITAGSDPCSLPLASVEVAFAGRSNVGKSSLINALLSRKNLVRTSKGPGCTRQINFFDIRARDDARLVLVDLPGYGFAKRSKAERAQWADLIEGYLLKRPSLRAIVLLVDARRGLEEDDLELLDFVEKRRGSALPPLHTVVVATKVDKLPRSKAVTQLEALRKQSRRPVLQFSTVTKVGYEELWRAVRKAVGLGPAHASPTLPQEA